MKFEMPVLLYTPNALEPTIGAQVWNHTFYFDTFSPKGGGVPTGALAEAINKNFGGFENFQKEFNAASLALFGSGWTWLSKDKGCLGTCLLC